MERKQNECYLSARTCNMYTRRVYMRLLYVKPDLKPTVYIYDL